ncbi:hypothetical protein [Paenibacillus elgii]|uniref:hypothetical protein n=1 Tax=Paenibacillus elgii TaxID=189691 RepID=UPI001675A65E|nr:hypothetical protein [Paenibacillus elgii]
MQPLRSNIQSKATERFETQPGQQVQVDWGYFRVEQDGGHDEKGEVIWNERFARW